MSTNLIISCGILEGYCFVYVTGMHALDACFGPTHYWVISLTERIGHRSRAIGEFVIESLRAEIATRNSEIAGAGGDD